MRVLVFGDSITQGFWGIEGGWVERLRKHYDGIAVQDLMNNKQPEIFNLGVSGDTTRNLLDRIEHEVKVRKWPSSPLYVVIAIGTKDDLFENGEQLVPPNEFKQNIKKIIEMLTPKVNGFLFVGNAACDEKLTTPVFWDDIHYTNEQMEKYENIIRDIVEEKRMAFVPIYKEFNERLSKNEKLLQDGLHPNDAGHQLIFELVRPKLDEVLKK